MAERKTTKLAKEKASKQGMKKENKAADKIKCTVKDGVKCNETGGCFYFLGFIGALVYYVSTAPTFWDAVIGFFKAIVWPAFLVYGLLVSIGA